MSQEKKPLDPDLVKQVEQVEQAVAASKEEVLRQHVVDALLKVTPDDLISPDPEAEIIKGGTRPSEGWLHAPANLELLATAVKRLTRVANQDGIMVKKVEKAHVKLIKGTKLMVIKAAAKEDLTALAINYYAGTSSAWINCISLLGDADLKVETGYRELYDVAYVPKNSPLWPALVIDLGAHKERKVESDKKSDESSDKKTEKSSAKKAEASADKKAEASADKKAEASADKKAEASADKPAEQTTTKDSAGTGTEQK